MNEDRLSILKLLEEGKITVDDAFKLLEAIENPASDIYPQARLTSAETLPNKEEPHVKPKSKFKISRTSSHLSAW